MIPDILSNDTQALLNIKNKKAMLSFIAQLKIRKCDTVCKKLQPYDWKKYKTVLFQIDKVEHKESFPFDIRSISIEGRRNFMMLGMEDVSITWLSISKVREKAELILEFKLIPTVNTIDLQPSGFVWDFIRTKDRYEGVDKYYVKHTLNMTDYHLS